MSEAIQPQLAFKVRMGAALPCAQVNIIAMTHFGPVIDPRHEVDPRDKVEVDEVVAAPEPSNPRQSSSSRQTPGTAKEESESRVWARQETRHYNGHVSLRAWFMSFACPL